MPEMHVMHLAYFNCVAVSSSNPTNLSKIVNIYPFAARVQHNLPIPETTDSALWVCFTVEMRSQWEFKETNWNYLQVEGRIVPFWFKYTWLTSLLREIWNNKDTSWVNAET